MSGSNNTIQHAGVQYMIASVIAELLKDPSRTFTYVEMAFFSRWFYEQTSELQDAVRGLVASGQLSFANGGWCMHDEAAAHYAAMIDQTTLGHQFLAKEFDGYCPRVGWQIDPFGHSSTQASLLSWGAGFDALYFGRIDYQDRLLRQASQECEGVWRASESLGPDAQVFWGLTGQYGGNYYGPDGFDWDVTNNNAIPCVRVGPIVAECRPISCCFLPARPSSS
jgi:alpha-mannosidase